MPIITTSPSTGAQSPIVNPSTGAVTNPAGRAGGMPYFQQPLFDPRIYSLAFPMEQSDTTSKGKGGAFNGGLTRGMMVWDKAYSPYTQKATMQFLFNPTTVTTCYCIDASDVASSLVYRSPADTAAAAFAMNQSVSFSLYYDRTFELWGSYIDGSPRPQTYGPNGKLQNTTANNNSNTSLLGYEPTDPTVFGVNVDITAMKQLTGQFLTTLQPSGGSAPSNPNGTPGLSQQGVMCMLPTWLYFGSETALVYYGYISEFDVTVTHWTQFMVPMRAVIDVTFALLIPSTSNSMGPDFTNWSVFEQIAAATSAAAASSNTTGISGR